MPSQTNKILKGTKRKLNFSISLCLLCANTGYPVPQPAYPATSPHYPVAQQHSAPTAPSPGFVYPPPVAGPGIPPQPPPRGYREHAATPPHHHQAPDPHASITPYMPVGTGIPPGLEYLTQVRAKGSVLEEGVLCMLMVPIPGLPAKRKTGVCLFVGGEESFLSWRASASLSGWC